MEVRFYTGFEEVILHTDLFCIVLYYVYFDGDDDDIL